MVVFNKDEDKGWLSPVKFKDAVKQAKFLGRNKIRPYKSFQICKI